MENSTHVLIIVQNLPVPLDRRVWLECQALTSAGYDVSVICPKGPQDPDYQVIDGVHIYKYRPAPEAEGALGYLFEFGYSWARTAALSLKVWRRQPFQTLQACNPPDTYWALARLWSRRGVKFVFDHHDLNPELFRSRFGEPEGLARRLQYKGLLWLERMTFRSADRVISTNNSYRGVAIDRGGVDPAHVTVVRSCPDTTAMRPIYSDVAQIRTTRFNLAYLGIMGPQDRVDLVLDVMHELVNVRGRDDVHAWLLGFGDCYEDLLQESRERGLQDRVTFTGRADKSQIAEYLSASDVGLCPDPKTPLNDVSTMNKTMEYMAYGLPSVAFDLVETRVSGGDTAIYVPSEDIGAYADAVELLLDDEALRIGMGRAARERVASQLDWSAQAIKYFAVHDAVSGMERPVAELHAVPSFGAGHDVHGHRFVDQTDEMEFDRFLAQRSAPEAASWLVPSTAEELINGSVIEATAESGASA